jgi:DNA primase small subunit
MSKGKRTTTIMKLRLLFHEYYSDSINSIDIPDKIHSREFSLMTWENNWHCTKKRYKDETGTDVLTGCGQSGKSFQPVKICPNCGSDEVKSTNWVRHMGYRSQGNLLAGLSTFAPQGVYHSAAFYRVPTATLMAEKEWLGAELIFDIDADHLDLKCANEHDTWQCKNPDCKKIGSGKAPDICPECGDTWKCENKVCNLKGSGPPPAECPNCKSETSQILMGFNTWKWVCGKCLKVARKHTMRLIDSFLIDDFNFDPDKIQVNYSGHRGYHVRVRDPNIFKLSSDARTEIVHYVMGLGFRVEKAIIQQGGINLIPARSSPGWNGKVADAIVEFIQNIDEYPGRERWAAILRKKENKEIRLAALTGLQREKPILGKGIGLKSWQEIAECAVESFGSQIDRPVTHDIHRVIRLIGSLHGKTGFIASLLTRDRLDDFNPFNESIAFNQGTMKVIFHKGPIVPTFKINDETYGPFKNEETVELPIAAAVFVLCKGVASLE